MGFVQLSPELHGARTLLPSEKFFYLGFTSFTMGEEDKTQENKLKSKATAAFSRLAKKIGLKETSIQILVDQEYNKQEALATISDEELY